MFISSNYLSVSGEHRVHFNTNVCSRFCCTPRPFQAYGYPLLLLYLGGFGLHPSLSAGVCAICSGVLKAISSVTLPHRFLFLSTYTTLYSLFSDFSLSPVFTAVDFRITALHRDRLMSVIGFVRRLLRLLIILRPDTPIFLTGERIGVFFGAFCALLLSWYLLTVWSRP